MRMVDRSPWLVYYFGLVLLLWVVGIHGWRGLVVFLCGVLYAWLSMADLDWAWMGS